MPSGPVTLEIDFSQFPLGLGQTPAGEWLTLVLVVDTHYPAGPGKQVSTLDAQC